MTETTDLTIIGIIDGYRVRTGDIDKVVNGVKIAGNEVEFRFAEITIEATDWGIEGEYDPYLLIESAEWYNSPDE